MIFCRTLGPVEVVSDSGEPIDIRGNKNRALLIYLARSPKRSRSREQLTGLLWADKPDEKARHSLREAVRVLRRQLGEAIIESSSDEVRLTGTLLRLDVEDFEALEKAGNWESAAALVAGEFLDGLAIKGAWVFEEWLTAERTLWRGRSTHALASRCDELLDSGRVTEAVRLAMRAQVLDPGSAVAVQAAMRSLALSGERAEALGVYDTHLARLGELGADPDADTARLAEQVKLERSWHLPPSVEAGAAKGATSRRTPLVGRGDELAALLDGWERCRTEGAARCAVIEGDSGTGKTRLAEELVARARLSGATVAATRSVQGDLGLPGSGALGLARGGIMHGAGLATASPRALSAFAAEIPEWADRFGIPKGDTQQVGTAIVDVLRAVTAEQPTMLLVDDGQWCDRETILALVAALRDLNSAPLFVCFSFAPQPERAELDDLRSRIGRDLAGAAIRLEPLDEAALRELTEWALPEYSPDEVGRLTRRVVADSAGLPLLAVELLHAVALGMDLEGTAGPWPRPLRTLSQTLPGDLPDAIVGAIRVGFRRLSKNAQELLVAVAVLENPVAADVLSRCTNLLGEDLNRALDELEWQRWLAADVRGYSFIARIVRDVVARDMVTSGQKQRVFKAAAESL